MNEQERWMRRWENALVAIGAFGLVVAVLVLSWALGAVIAMWAWGLFMVPVFGLPELNFTEAFGLILLLALVRLYATRSNTEGKVRKTFNLNSK